MLVLGFKRGVCPAFFMKNAIKCNFFSKIFCQLKKM